MLLPLIGTLFTFVGFNVVDVVIIKSGLQSIFGWNPVVVAVVITVIAALVAIFGHDCCTRPSACCSGFRSRCGSS